MGVSLAWYPSSECRFTFWADRCLVGERGNTDSDPEEGLDGPSVMTAAESLTGAMILAQGLVGVFLLRGNAVDRRICGRTEFLLIILSWLGHHREFGRGCKAN